MVLVLGMVLVQAMVLVLAIVLVLAMDLLYRRKNYINNPHPLDQTNT